ncbi:Putative uncharacterized protein [Thermobacillus xylanilyticus]|uniref:Uncharacterized protein n=2 Tax=Thermobacillus xylanilyticus TaxID=76633 RepID=A0ABN7RYC0_THEXY|nr:Putative uncharacterized protein [Thermobacillus xylanilyticus]
MRKRGLVLGAASAVLVALVGFLFVMNRWFYPPLPVPDVSAKEAVKKLEASDRVLAELASAGGVRWYIDRNGEGIGAVDDAVKRMSEAEGWTFTSKEGAGLFFEKDGERRIATTRIWNRKYVLVKVQDL